MEGEGNNTAMVNEAGGFTQVFTDHVKTEFPDSKVFDDVKGLTDLAKVYHDTKTAFGARGTELTTANEALTAANSKMETGLFPLSEDADDTAKGEYAKRLAALNGFDGKTESYKMPRIEGIEYGKAEEATEKAIVEMAIAKGIPPAVVNQFTEFHNAVQKQLIADEMAEFQADSKQFDTDFPGDNKQVALRSVFKALEHFASDELEAKMKEAGLFDSTDLALWNKYIPIPTIRIFEQVHAKTMAGGELLGGGVMPNMDGVHPESDFAKAAKAFPGQPEMLVGKSKEAPAGK